MVRWGDTLRGHHCEESEGGDSYQFNIPREESRMLWDRHDRGNEMCAEIYIIEQDDAKEDDLPG